MSEILVKVTRGQIVENLHRGDIVVVDSKGNIIAKAGDPFKITFMRSSAKPLQASAVAESGALERFGIDDRELAVMCASHYAEEFHIEIVKSILTKIGLDENALRCGEAYSLNEAVAESYIRRGESKKRIFHNCSGKHSGMLTLAVHEGYDLDSYDKLENPVQQKMLMTVSEYAGIDKEKIGIGIDGCGVPVHAMPLYNMALSYSRLSMPKLLSGNRREAASRIVRAMTAYPEMVAGTGGFCTELMKRTGGKIVGKLGADGVYCLGIVGEGIALAIKIEDGNPRVLSCAVLETLKQLNLITEAELEALSKFYVKDNINAQGIKVGEMRAEFKLDVIGNR